MAGHAETYRKILTILPTALPSSSVEVTNRRWIPRSSFVTRLAIQ